VLERWGQLIDRADAGITDPAELFAVGLRITGRRALGQLAARGISTARIAVRSDEAPAELLQAANVTVDAPQGAAAQQRTLL
jgi:hypothetical protein